MMPFWITLLLAAALSLTDAVPYDLRPFEAEILPKWFELFAVDASKGEFAYEPQSEKKELYGTLDAVHVSKTCGVPIADEAAWAATIQAAQRRTGWFEVSKDAAPGKQPYHAAASATAALRLLGKKPLYANAAMDRFLQDRGGWEARFGALYASECPSKKLNGSNNVHSCGQIIGSYPVLIDDSGFREWWVEWVLRNTDPAIGVVCPLKNSTIARVECVGGAMPTHGVELGLGLVETLPYPSELLDFSLSVQQETGGAWSDTLPTDLGSLSLDGVLQVTRASASLVAADSDAATRPPALRRRASIRKRAEASCRTLLDIAVPQLTDAERVLGYYANTSHTLPNVLAAVAECAQTFEGLVLTSRPWSCCAAYV